METLDIIVISVYFDDFVYWIILLKKKDNTSEYFLANRNLGWFVVGAFIRFKYWI